MSLNEQLNENYWQDMERPEKMKKLATDKILCDCEFLVGPEDSTAEIIAGHKIFFVIESPVFENMFTGNFIEASEKQIRISDIHPNDFKNFRDIIYNKDYNKYSKLSLLEVFELYRIADKYLVSSICGDCIQYMISITQSLEIRKLLMLFEFAFNMEDKTLQIYVEKEISARQSETIFDARINDFSFDLFYNYILFIQKFSTYNKARGILAPKPRLIFDAIQTYFHFNNLLTKRGVSKRKELKEISGEEAGKQTKKLLNKKETNLGEFEHKDVTDKNTAVKIYEEKSIIMDSKNEMFDIINLKRKLFKLINFNEMSVDEFVNGPGKSDLLELDEKYKLLTRLCAKNNSKIIL